MHDQNYGGTGDGAGSTGAAKGKTDIATWFFQESMSLPDKKTALFRAKTNSRKNNNGSF